MRELHLLDLEDLLTTETAAIAIGERWLMENLPSPLLPLEVRYMDATGERQSVEVVRAVP